MDRKRLFLIDGSALYYRSYFAFIRNPLINSRGENTSAVFGFALYLMKIVFEEKPDYLGVVFDTKAPTFRHEMYEPYKATREKMPEEMAAQFPHIIELVKAFQIPQLELDGYEADDIIATLAKRAEGMGVETFMATADKDMMQVLSPMIKMYSMRPGSDAEIIDEAYLMEKLGLRPAQVIDYLALMGDSSDNVPGVPKVGKKTAQSLLGEYGSIQGIYDNLEQISKKAVQQSLRENRELAEMSRQLVTLHCDVPVEVDFSDLALSPVDLPAVMALYEHLEFRNQIPRLLKLAEESGSETVGAKPGSYDPEQQQYHLVDTAEKLRSLAAQLQKQNFVVFDTETTGLDAFSSEVIGISFAWKAGEAYYVPLNGEGLKGEAVIEALKPVLEDPRIKKGGQNIKFDALMLYQHGVEIAGIEFDTLIAAYLISPGSRQHNLDALAQEYLNYHMISIEELIGPRGKNQKTMDDVDIAQVAVYASEDADITFRLKVALEKQLKKTDMEKLFHEVEMPLVEVLIQMEKHGVRLDVDFLNEMSKALDDNSQALEKEICRMAGEDFNVKSPKQLGDILFEKLAIHIELGKRRPARTPTGQYKTAEADLLKYQAHPLVDKILEYRKLTKLKSTYVDALPKLVSRRSGHLHTSYNQTVAATGRLSSSDPNLQNIPIRGETGREIRKAFIPSAPGWVIFSADYSQVELRVMAHISGDPGLRQAFEQGEDIHRATAAAVFGVAPQEVTPEQRRKAKEVNFGIIYGISRFGLAGRLGISNNDAEAIIQNYFAKYPNVNRYITETIAFAREHKYVTTLLNRRRYISDIASANGNIRQNAERAAINSPIQGSAADLIKLAMIHIHRALEAQHLQARMILQVHDELVFELPESELPALTALVKEKMESAMQLAVPLKVDTGSGTNWLEAH